MTDRFKGFDFTALTSSDAATRKAAETQNAEALQHPVEYVRFLTQEIVAANEQAKACLGLSVLKMVISKASFPASLLLEILDYYSNLFIASRVESFIAPFSLLFEALLLQIDSQLQKMGNSSEKEANQAQLRSCYINKESLLLEGNWGSVEKSNPKFLLVFLRIYLDQLITKNINLTALRKQGFKKIYEKVNSIGHQQNQKQTPQFTMIKAQFLLKILQNTRKISVNIFLKYFSIIPKQMCEYGIEMMKQKLIDLETINIIFSFIFKHYISLKTSDGTNFLGEQLETHLAFAKFIGLLITQTNKAQFNINSQIEQEGTLSISSKDSEEELSPAFEQYAACKIRIEQWLESLYFWLFKVLLIHKTTSESAIFELFDPLQAAYTNLFFENDGANHFISWMMKRYEQGVRGESNFESFCYYFYYLQAHFYRDNNLNNIKQMVGGLALQDLKVLRFSKTINMCSVLYYLRVYIGTNLSPQNFHSETISIIMALFNRFNCDEFSQAMLTCFTPDCRFNSKRTCQVTNSIWPLISYVSPLSKQQILRSLRYRLEQEDEISSEFITDLLSSISQNQATFENSYKKEAIYVKVEYLRLISLSIVRLGDCRSILKQIVHFLETILRGTPRDSLQIVEIMQIFTSILYLENKKTNLKSILPDIRIVDLLLQNLRFLFKEVKLYTPLFIQIASLPYFLNEIENFIAVHKLQTSTIEYLLTFELNDQICDILEIFFTLNASAISPALTECILKKTANTPNYFRMAYILSPQPYPSSFNKNIELLQLKHYKWAILFIIGKSSPSSFATISRSPRDETIDLVHKFSAMEVQLQSDEFYCLMMLRGKLVMFSKDDEGSWISGVEKSAVSSIFSQLYQEKYRRCSLEQIIKKHLGKFEIDLL